MTQLLPDDLLLVQRGQLSYKFNAGDLLSQIEDEVSAPLVLSDLQDVNTSGVTEGQFLQYNSSSGIWEPVTLDMPNALEFKGVVDATVGSSAPETPESGDVWVNSGTGNVDAHGPALTAQPWSAVNSSSTPTPVGRYWVALRTRSASPP